MTNKIKRKKLKPLKFLSLQTLIFFATKFHVRARTRLALPRASPWTGAEGLMAWLSLYATETGDGKACRYGHSRPIANAHAELH